MVGVSGDVACSGDSGVLPKVAPIRGVRWVVPVVVSWRHGGGPRWSGGGGNPRERESP